MNARILIAALLAACSAAAQAAETTPPTPLVSLAYDAGVNDKVPAVLPGACRINVVGISDNRFAKEGMGADAPVRTGAPEPWIGAALANLKQYGYTVQQGAAPAADALNLDVKLIRAYSWFGNMRINGMVAVDVSIATPEGVRSRKFRASGSKTNMMGADSEHVTALNYALNHMVHEMASGLASECAGLKVAAR